MTHGSFIEHILRFLITMQLSGEQNREQTGIQLNERLALIFIHRRTTQKNASPLLTMLVGIHVQYSNSN